jgi:hypothetical protein
MSAASARSGLLLRFNHKRASFYHISSPRTPTCLSLLAHPNTAVSSLSKLAAHQPWRPCRGRCTGDTRGTQSSRLFCLTPACDPLHRRAHSPSRARALLSSAHPTRLRTPSAVFPICLVSPPRIRKRAWTLYTRWRGQAKEVVGRPASGSLTSRRRLRGVWAVNPGEV